MKKSLVLLLVLALLATMTLFAGCNEEAPENEGEKTATSTTTENVTNATGNNGSTEGNGGQESVSAANSVVGRWNVQMTKNFFLNSAWGDTSDYKKKEAENIDFTNLSLGILMNFQDNGGITLEIDWEGYIACVCEMARASAKTDIELQAEDIGDTVEEYLEFEGYTSMQEVMDEAVDERMDQLTDEARAKVEEEIEGVVLNYSISGNTLTMGMGMGDQQVTLIYSINYINQNNLALTLEGYTGAEQIALSKGMTLTLVRE